MEKRKLAKIPSEEASDEMVRFSDRATGTHIITTREIEKDLLMLNFYPIKGLKKGKKEAQIRTFFSKNDYITQDLTTEKVKWLTAAFDRMDCISLYKYHWDRETGNRYTPNMLFWTDSDIDRMRKFFKEWSTEKDDKDWTAVTRFQDMVKQRRLDEKHAKETNPIDAVMETVKEIPEDFKKWVSEKAMSFSRYLIYSARSKNEALAHCTYCNGTTLIDRTKIRLRNNEKGICPLCGSPVTIKARGRMPMHIWDERIVSFIEPREEGFLWRYFTAHREVKPEGKYFAYQKMFTEGEINTCTSRTALIGAMTRAKMCTEEKQPAVFQIEDDVLNISIRDKLADYQEQVPLQETVCKSIRLGFDSRLVLETLKAFTCDNIALGFTSPRTPMIVEAEDSDMKAMVLPVAIREA